MADFSPPPARNCKRKQRLKIIFKWRCGWMLDFLLSFVRLFFCFGGKKETISTADVNTQDPTIVTTWTAATINNKLQKKNPHFYFTHSLTTCDNADGHVTFSSSCITMGCFWSLKGKGKQINHCTYKQQSGRFVTMRHTQTDSRLLLVAMQTTA